MGATINRKTLFVPKIEIPRVPFARPSSPPLPLLARREVCLVLEVIDSQRHRRTVEIASFFSSAEREAYPANSRPSPQFVDAEINFEAV